MTHASNTPTPATETAPDAHLSGADRQTDNLPPLKTPVTFRASVHTLDALAYIQQRLNCDKTAAIELSIAWDAAHMATETRI